MTSIDWASLHHAYGPATDIPDLLSRAQSAPASDDYQAEPWFSLWSALYHQDDIYPASYAAVPELIRIAEGRSDSGAIEALLLAASIELQRHTSAAPTIPIQLEAVYAEACKRAGSLSTRVGTFASRPDDPRRVAIAEAVFRGNLSRARHLLGEDDDADNEL